MQNSNFSNYELHPLCSLFPRMAGDEFASLCADISANGLRDPITLNGGMVLDGGNRYRACLESGVEPQFVEFAGSNLVSFVFSANLHRRHLSPGQQAAIVASAQDWAMAQTVGGNGSNQHSVAKVQDCTFATAKDRAAASGAHINTQKMADKVAKASPELAIQVAHGEKSLPEAVEELTGKRPGSKKPKLEVVVSDELAFLRSENEALRESSAEIAKNAQEAIDDNNSMAEVFESDDRLVAAMAKIKQLTELVRVLEERNRGMLNKEAEAIKAAKRWQRKYDALVKEYAKEAA